MSDSHCQVYFAECIGPNGEPIGAIKIGCSNGWKSRLKSAASGLPFTLELRAAVLGNGILEKVCHQTFAEDRISGEYFRPSKRILECIDRINAQGRAFARFVDLSEDTVPDGALKGFLDYHAIDFLEVCRRLGHSEAHTRQIMRRKNGYYAKSAVAAASVLAMEKGHYVTWPSDAMRGLLGETSPLGKKEHHSLTTTEGQRQ